MLRPTTSFSSPARTQGAALIICMVLLLIISFVAVRGATTADLQVQMARVEQYALYEYDTARSELIGQYRELLEELDELESTINQPINDPRELPVEGRVMSPGSQYDLSVEYNYLGKYGETELGWTPPPGRTLNHANIYFFTVRSRAALTNTSSDSIQEIGVTYSLD